MAELSPFQALRCTAGARRDNLPLEAGPFHAARPESTGGNNPAELLREWMEDGIVKQDTDPGLYIYEQEFTHLGQRKKVRGFLSLVKIEEEPGILTHEETFPSEVQERLALLEATSCQFSPIYSFYEDDGRKTMSRIRLLSSGKPRMEFSERGVTHRLWVVNDILAIAAIWEDFAPRRLFLADGHHRWAAAAEWKKRGGPDSALMFLADAEQDMTILPAHCLVRGTFEEKTFLAGCEPYFDVIRRGTTDEIPANLDALYRQGKKAFAFYSGGANWTLLILKDSSVMAQLLPDKSEPFRELDSSILHSLILEHLFQLPAQDSSEPSFLSFSSSMQETLNSVRGGLGQCAFLLNPARVKEIREISVTGEKMPPKSTAFYPAPPAGMIMYLNKG